MAESFVLDAATWRVQDLSASLAFYQRLGFRALRVDAERAELVPAGSCSVNRGVLGGRMVRH